MHDCFVPKKQKTETDFDSDSAADSDSDFVNESMQSKAGINKRRA